ncbi:MAG: hypothetical protein V5A62_07105 [Haloarculaceae archaeon]
MEEAARSALNYLRRRPGKLYEWRFEPHVAYLRLRYRYGPAAPKPWQILHVSPEEIEYVLTPPFWRRELSYTAIDVRAGDWDLPDSTRWVPLNRHGFDRRAPVPFTAEHYGWYRSVEQHFLRGVPWEETVAHEHYSTHQSEDRAEEKRTHLQWLYDSIEADGYKAPAELVASDRDYPRGWQHPNYNTVIVDVGRDGTFMLEDGKNRATLAKVMGVDVIPVRVLVRHERWQAIRSEVYAADSVDDLSERARRHLDHPDVRPLVRDLR